MRGRQRARDLDAEFTAFVASRQVHLRRVAYAVCGDWHEAEDLLQVALTKLYVAWPRVHRDGREEAYARRIVVRAAIDEHRRRERRPEHPRRPALDDVDPVSGQQADVEERSALVDALQQLPSRQRAVVVLRHWLDLSVAETAAELGISEGTVKSHTSRGVAALQRALTPQG